MSRVVVDDGEISLEPEDGAFRLTVQINEQGDAVSHRLTAEEVRSLLSAAGDEVAFELEQANDALRSARAVLGDEDCPFLDDAIAEVIRQRNDLRDMDMHQLMHHRHITTISIPMHDPTKPGATLLFAIDPATVSFSTRTGVVSPTPPETACTSCCSSWSYCMNQIDQRSRPCCTACRNGNTHRLS